MRRPWSFFVSHMIGSSLMASIKLHIVVVALATRPTSPPSQVISTTRRYGFPAREVSPGPLSTRPVSASWSLQCHSAPRLDASCDLARPPGRTQRSGARLRSSANTPHCKCMATGISAGRPSTQSSIELACETQWSASQNLQPSEAGGSGT